MILSAHKNTLGFTLIELLIVVAIVGILAAIAYPSYQNQVRKTHRTTAQSDLMENSGFMERYYTENNCYANVGADGACSTGDDTDPALPITQSPRDGTFQAYNLIMQANTGTAYTLRAVPIAGTTQTNDGYLELTSTGLRRWDKNNDGDTDDAGENSWEK